MVLNQVPGNRGGEELLAGLSLSLVNGQADVLSHFNYNKNNNVEVTTISVLCVHQQALLKLFIMTVQNIIFFLVCKIQWISKVEPTTFALQVFKGSGYRSLNSLSGKWLYM